MDGMDVALLATLVFLALVDSTSIGTLLIPVWLLIAPGRVRVARMIVFLSTIAGFYLVLGIALVAGLSVVADDLARVLDGAVAVRIQLVLGVGMIVGSFFVGRRRRTAPEGGGRTARWRERALGGGAGGGVAGLIGLALTAAALEAATMLPYLAAAGLIGSSGLPWAGRLALLGGYCLVMILPALVLTAARVMAARQVEPVLTRFAAWMQRTSGETLGWVIAIVGFLVARDAIGRMPEIIAWLDRL